MFMKKNHITITNAYQIVGPALSKTTQVIQVNAKPD